MCQCPTNIRRMHSLNMPLILRSTSIWVALFVVVIYKDHISALQVIPERVTKVNINKKYVDNASLFVKRYDRKSGYFLNLEGTTKQTFGNNVSLHLVLFELMQNEYKPSFVSFHGKICDMLHSDPYVGKTFANVGMVCPVPAGYHKFHNLSVPADNFPNVWPFERCKIEASLTQSPTGDVIATANIFLYFKQKPKLG